MTVTAQNKDTKPVDLRFLCTWYASTTNFPKLQVRKKEYLKLFERIVALMNCYLSHTVGLKARLLALYFIAPSQTSDRAVSTYQRPKKSGDSQKMTASKKRLEYVKRVNKEKM